MLSEAQVAQFDRNGFLNAGQVLEADQVQALSDALDAVIEKGPDGFAEGETSRCCSTAWAGAAIARSGRS
jgi:hypothetical protein